MNDSSLHEFIISCFLYRQRPPFVREIAARFTCDEVHARLGLLTLADNHGVVLHPKSDEIWVTHPFSAASTTCVVKSDMFGRHRLTGPVWTLSDQEARF